jgi:hypothetical protein
MDISAVGRVSATSKFVSSDSSESGPNADHPADCLLMPWNFKGLNALSLALTINRWWKRRANQIALDATARAVRWRTLSAVAKNTI